MRILILLALSGLSFRPCLPIKVILDPYSKAALRCKAEKQTLIKRNSNKFENSIFPYSLQHENSEAHCQKKIKNLKLSPYSKSTSQENKQDLVIGMPHGDLIKTNPNIMSFM